MQDAGAQGVGACTTAHGSLDGFDAVDLPSGGLVAAEVDVAIHALNRMLELERPIPVRIV